MNGRRLVHRALIGTAVIVVVLLAITSVAAIVQLTVGSERLAERISELATGTVLGEGTRLRVGDLDGNGVTGLTLRDVVVEVEVADGWRPWCSIERIDLRYQARELLGRPWQVRGVDVVGVEIDTALERGPRFEALGDGGAPGADARPWLTIDRLRVAPAIVHRGEDEPVTADLELRVEVGEGYVGVDLADSQLGLGDRFALALSGPLEVRGSAVYLEAVTVESGSSRVTASGVLDGRQGARLRLELAPLVFADWAPLTGWQIDADPGEVSGAAELEGEWSDLELYWDLAARFGVDEVETLVGTGSLMDGALVVHETSLSVNGTPLAGEGRLSLRRGETSWGRVQFSDVPLASFPVLRNQGWLPSGSLTGTVRVGSATDGVRPFELQVSRGDIHGFLIEPGTFRGRIEPGAVVQLDTVEVVTAGGRLRGRGTIDPEQGIDLQQSLAVDDLEAFAGMFAEAPPVGGAGELRLAVVGPLRAPAFSISGRMDSLDVATLGLADVTLSVGPGILRRALETGFEFTAADGTLGERRLGRIACQGNLRDNRLRIGNLQVAAPETEVALRGHLSWLPDGLDFRLDELSGLVQGRHWRTTRPLVGRRRGTLWELESCALTSEAGTVEGALLIDRQTGQLELDLHLGQLDLELLTATGATGDLRGRIDGDIELRGGLDAPALRVAIDAAGFGVESFAVDSLSVRAALADSLLALERVVVVRGGVTEIEGQVELPTRLAGRDSWRELVRFATWRDARVDLQARSSGCDLTAWHGLTDALDAIAGTVAFAMEFQGRASHLDGRASVGSDHLQVGTEVMEDVEAQLRFEQGWIHVQELRMRLGNASLIAHGRSPVHLSLAAAPRFDRQAPVSLTVNLEPGDLSLSRFIDDRVIDTGGPVTGWVMVTGTIDAPRYIGEFDLRDATLRPTGREEVLREVEARIVLADDAVHVDEVRARSGRNGTVEAHGVLFLRDGKVNGYDFDLAFEEFPVRLTGEYQGRLSGTLSYSRAAGFPKPLPVINADLYVHRMDYLREVVGGGDQGPPQPSTWVGRLEVEFPRSAWVRNENLEAEFKGNLVYERNPAGRALLGELEIIRGTYDLFGHTFRMRRGEVHFVDPARIDPELDVEAQARLQDTRVTATISGRASDRQISLVADDPDIDQATLWTMMVPTETADVSNLVAMTPFIRDFERRLSQDIPGITVSIETSNPDVGSQSAWGARVGTYLGDEVFVSAFQGFASTTDQDVEVEYQLSNIVFLKGQAVRRGVIDSGSKDVEEEYNLNLNLRWEF